MDTQQECQNLIVPPTRRRDRNRIAVVSPLPPPEEVFVDWLMSIPHDACLEAAAQHQIGLIDRHRPLHPDVLTLRALLSAFAGAGVWSKPVTTL